MRWLFDIENPVMRLIIKIFDCMCLSILWLICCLPVVTAGAATAALYATVHRYIRKEEGHLLRTFFGAIRENWKRATLVWLVVLAAGIALYGLVLRRWLPGGELLWYTLAILMGIAYLLVTAAAPEGALFSDPLGVPTMSIPW